MKPYIAQSSEFHGQLNPTGLWNAKFLMLASALERGDHPDNVKQALFDWLSEKNFSQAQVEALLHEPPETAVETIVKKLGAGLRADRLPRKVYDTLLRTLGYIAKDYRQRRAGEIRQELAKFRTMKKQYPAESLAESLLK